MPVLVELCIASVEDAVAAAAGGADRVELNSALPLGGLTPSAGLLAEVRRAVRLPVVAMARPRAGGFCYAAAEFAVLRRDVDFALDHGADGVAFGVLCDDGRVDVERCREVVRQVGPRAGQGAVFHRAFDFTPDPFDALEQLIDAGVRRVMTSGQRPTAAEGAELVGELIRHAAGRIEVLAAGGVRPWNVAELVARTGCDQVHAALREPRPDPSTRARPDLPLAAGPPADADVTSPRLLRELLRAVGRMGPT